MTTTKKVAIIGGGAAGVETAKEMLEQGLEPTIFEKNDKIGGVWRNDLGNVWSNMHTNLTRFNVIFSNCSFPSTTSLFPSGIEVQDYLIEFSKKFDLNKHTICNTTITKVKHLDDGKWLVKWETKDIEEVKEDIFEYLVIAIGSFSNPYSPNYDSMSLFKGKIIHSMFYNLLKKTEDLKNKKVIVVGHSFSGTEISADLVYQDSQVLNVFNRPYWIVPKFLNTNTNNGKLIPIDFVFLNREAVYANKQFKSKKDLYLYKNNLMAKLCKDQNQYPELYVDPNSTLPPYISISEDYMRFIKEGKLNAKKGCIEKFTENGVVFNDGTFEDADYVIFCTGYRCDLSFFDEEILQKLEYINEDANYPFLTYKNTFHPDIENLAFIGIKKSFYPIIELQARWASLVFSGKVKLPSREIMLNQLNEERELRKLNPRERTTRLDGLLMIVDEVAEEINSLPNFEELKIKNPRLYKILWKGPLSSAHYKLNDQDESIKILFNEIESEMMKLNL